MENTKFTIETTDRNEATLMINALKLAGVLYDILSWYRAIYNGKDYDHSVIRDGELMDLNTYYKLPHDDKEHKVQCVYTQDQIERKLEELTSDISDIINNHYV